MRYALYFTPDPKSPLGLAAARWLGRDVFTGRKVTTELQGALSPPERAFHAAAPRRYGFHGTLKAPFRLAEGVSEAQLLNDFDRFCADEMPVQLPRLEVSVLDRFLALTPVIPSPELDALACKVVMHFDRFRAPLTEADKARRHPDQLGIAELRNLYRWGYPHVLDRFRFHMTLTGPVSERDKPVLKADLDSWFADCLSQPVTLDRLSIFIEPEPGAPFLVRHHRMLGIRQDRMTA